MLSGYMRRLILGYLSNLAARINRNTSIGRSFAESVLEFAHDLDFAGL